MRWVFVITLLILTLPWQAHTQPAINYNDFKDSIPNDVTTLTVSNVEVVGTNRGLTVCVYESATNTGVTVSTVAFNTSESLTFVDEVVGGDTAVSFWYLVAPTATTADVLITFSASTGVNSVLMSTAVGLSNVEQAQPTLSNTNGCSGCTVATLDLTSTSANTMMLTCAKHNDGGTTFTHGAGQTELSDFNEPGGASDRMTTSFELKGVSGLETLETTSTNSGDLRMVAIGVQEAIAGGPPASRRAIGVQFR